MSRRMHRFNAVAHYLIGLMNGRRTVQEIWDAAIDRFQPGDDYKLASHQQLLDYFAKLDAASDRIVVDRIGKSSEGRDMIVAIISSEANIKNRARYQEIARRLSFARGTNEAEARALAKEGKAIVWIDGGLHATEVAGAQHTPELAWWLVSSESDEAKRVRDNAILVLMPSMNPDGLDIVRDWYYQNLGTPFETTSPPDIYHHYVGHDNNRDWTTFTQVETFARLIHGTLNPTEVAYHIANEGRKLVECDRLCVGVRHARRKVTVESVSGADVVEKASTHVRRLRKLMEAVNQWGETLTFKGTKDAGLPPDHEAYRKAVEFLQRCQNRAETGAPPITPHFLPK